MAIFFLYTMLFIYLAIIGLISAILFAIDKHRAQKHKWRIPEKVLHLFELLGGVFAIVPMMYIIRHKNKKHQYYLITYLILILWLAAIYFFMNMVLGGLVV